MRLFSSTSNTFIALLRLRSTPGESVAMGIVLLIDNLFGIDAEARAQNLGSISDPAVGLECRVEFRTLGIFYE